MVRPETKALLICAPHNPTGFLPTLAQFQAIIAFARQHDLLLFSDEVYRGLELDPTDRLPAACDLYERAVSLGALSKSHGLAGLRLGWIATRDADVLTRMSTFKGLSDDLQQRAKRVPRRDCRAPYRRPRHAGDGYHPRQSRRPRRVLHATSGYFHVESGHARARSRFPRLNHLPADDFCLQLLNRTGVLLLPSTLVDHGNQHFRIGFGRKNLVEILPIVEAYLKEIGAE